MWKTNQDFISLVKKAYSNLGLKPTLVHMNNGRAADPVSALVSYVERKKNMRRSHRLVVDRFCNLFNKDSNFVYDLMDGFYHYVEPEGSVRLSNAPRGYRLGAAIAKELKLS